MSKKVGIILLLVGFFIGGCIVNDIPYPRTKGEIIAIEVEQQDGVAQIDNESLEVYIKLLDNVTVDPKKIKLLRFEVSKDATVSPALEEYIDLSTPIQYTVTTYPGQDYIWTIIGEQIIERCVEVENQAEPAVIDPINKIVRVNVIPQQSLSNIKITKIKLGPTGATILPDPSTIHDFKVPRNFEVSYRDIKEKWTIQVVSVPVKNVTKADAWATKVILSGTYNASQGEPSFKYKKVSDTEWIVLPSTDIIKEGNKFSAEVKGLTPGTEYSYRSVIGETVGEDKIFTTEEAIQMVNSSFDEWFKKNKKIWFPNKDLTDANYFWDSGNIGANSLRENNPTSPVEDKVIGGKGKAAKMASTEVMGIFAAGSIYYGKYLKTDGLGAELSFGRPFTSRPTQVKFHYDYKSGTINKAKGDYSHLMNTADNCHIYALLTDWEAPFTINTKTSTFINMNDPKIIASGELISDETTNGYREYTIDLEYRREGVKPKYIVFVASASKYGDYFAGSTSSVLYLDEVELVY